MTELNEIRQVIEDCAGDLAQAVPDVLSWERWIFVMLESLESAAMEIDPDHPEQYEIMLSDLAANIAGRLEAGRW